MISCCSDHKFCILHLHQRAVAKKSSMFDDPVMEIQELTALIKDDITTLNTAVSDLQTLQNLEIADGTSSEDGVVHSNTVCDDLKNKLMGATKQLQDVLTTRTEVVLNGMLMLFLFLLIFTWPFLTVYSIHCPS